MKILCLVPQVHHGRWDIPRSGDHPIRRAPMEPDPYKAQADDLLIGHAT